MKILYEAYIYDEDTDEQIVHVSSYSESGLYEEMSKTKWTGAVKKYKDDAEHDKDCECIECEDKRVEAEADLELQTLQDNGIETVSNAVEDSGFKGQID